MHKTPTQIKEALDKDLAAVVTKYRKEPHRLSMDSIIDSLESAKNVAAESGEAAIAKGIKSVRQVG